MKEITYKITFLSDWHIGSGLSGGAEVDAIVLKDPEGLPYIPGKTLKGLFRDAIEDIKENRGLDGIEIEAIFGKEGIKSNLFFANAELFPDERAEIIANNLSDFLYRNIASTAINKDGIAENESLRVMEVCVPITLTGKISNIESQEINDMLRKGMKLIRSAGVNRNRGLGRCKFETYNDTNND